MLFVSLLMNSVLVFLSLLSVLIVIRAVYPIFASEEGLGFSFIFAATEPVMSPVRALFNKSEALSSSPIDFSGVATFMFIVILRALLSAFYI